MVRTAWNIIPELNGGTRWIEGGTRRVEGGRARSKVVTTGASPRILSICALRDRRAVTNANRPVVVTIQAHRRNEFHLLDTPLPPRIISRVTRMGR